MIPFIRSNYTPSKKGWKSEYTLSEENFTGGLNNVRPENLIEDNECVDCKNMRIFGKTILEKRPGIQHYGLDPLDDPITWLDIYRPTQGDSIIVRGTDAELYFGEDKICDVDGTVRGVTYFGKYFFVDGTCLRVWNPEKKDVYKVIEEPIAHTKRAYGNKNSSITVSSFELDVIPSTVEQNTPLYILGVSFGSELNFVAQVTSVSGTTVSFTPSLDLESGHILVKDSPIFFFNPLPERYTQGEEYWIDETHEVVYLPCINELSDSFAGEAYIPDSPNLIAIHQNRLVICGDSTQPHGVYISRTNQPLYFPANSSMAITPTGEKINNLFEFDGALIIGRKSDIHALYGYSEYSDSEGTFRIKKLDTTAGFMNDDCGAILQNYYIYLGSDGRFYLLTTPTTNVEYLMTKAIGYKIDIYKLPFYFTRSSSLLDDDTDVTVDCASHRNEVYFAIRQGSKNVVIVYNYDCMAFTYFVGWKAKTLIDFDDRLLIGKSDGYLDIYLDDSEIFSDNGVPISCNLLTKKYEPYGNTAFKFFKQVLVTSYIYENVESNIEFEVIVDHILHKIATSDNPDYSIWDESRWDENLFDPYQFNGIHGVHAVYDVSQWDEINFDQDGLYKSIWYLLNIRGRTIQYHLYNDRVNEGMRIYDINTIYTMRDVR